MDGNNTLKQYVSAATAVVIQILGLSIHAGSNYLEQTRVMVRKD